jgi:pheromone shutdown-related protein TraB
MTTPLSDNVTRLTDGDRTIYLVGTAHVSQESADEVSELIETVRPDTVCVELCRARYLALTRSTDDLERDLKRSLRNGQIGFALAGLALRAFQRRMGSRLGVRPGAEMLAAIEAAEKVGAQIELADRDVRITLRRSWASLSLRAKATLLAAIAASVVVRRVGVTAEQVEALKRQDVLEQVMDEFTRAWPQLRRPLIDERDEYLMSSVEAADGEVIVAVVGAGHIKGMIRHFGRPTDRAALEAAPEPPAWLRHLRRWLPSPLGGRG